ncbi:MAG: superoxide dismutase [Puniceicoccales bacterium]|jgi:Fe-Mn family superoxide dismutase|nr:superoxide dismutase [Puniceicoccales bacterium]
MQYSLPRLKYAYGALEPVFSAEMVELHYGKHHNAYVDKLNGLIQSLDYSVPRNINDLISGLKYSSLPEEYRDLVRFHAGGHANHSFLWSVLKPYDHGAENNLPEELEEIINRRFKTFRAFREEFEKAAMNHLGSGWAWLCVSEKKPQELFISTTLNHDNPQMLGYVPSAEFGFPIYTLDLWEHAYYLRYKNRKMDYINASWRAVNWDAVLEYYKAVVTN